MKEFEFNVNEKYSGYSIRDFLKSMGVSKEILTKLKKGLFVNQKPLLNINDKVNVGDKIKMVLPEDKKNPYIKAVKGDLQVLFEDEYFLAVNKKRGVLTHSSRGNSVISLEELVCGYFLPRKFTFRAVNRLDRDTEGVVLIAKDEYSASLLAKEIVSGNLKKYYSAVVVGEPKKEHFIIDAPIKRESPNGMKRIVSLDGKPAKTECFLEERLGEKSRLKILLHTGRTHQIRVHLSHVGLPLFADSLYGEKVDGESYYLVANCIEFTHPFTKELIKISVENK